MRHRPSGATGRRSRTGSSPELGDVQIKQLKRSQVQRFVDGMKRQVAPGTVRNAWAALAALYTYLLPRHDDMANPTQGVALPRPGAPRERYAEPSEMRALLEALPSSLATPYALAFYAGLRRAEIQALRLEDVENEWIVVRRAYDPKEGFKTTKSGRERQVPMFEPLRRYVPIVPRGLTLSFGNYDLSRLVLPSTRTDGPQMLGRPVHQAL